MTVPVQIQPLWEPRTNLLAHHCQHLFLDGAPSLVQPTWGWGPDKKILEGWVGGDGEQAKKWLSKRCSACVYSWAVW